MHPTIKHPIKSNTFKYTLVNKVLSIHLLEQLSLALGPTVWTSVVEELSQSWQLRPGRTSKGRDGVG